MAPFCFSFDNGAVTANPPCICSTEITENMKYLNRWIVSWWTGWYGMAYWLGITLPKELAHIRLTARAKRLSQEAVVHRLRIYHANPKNQEHHDPRLNLKHGLERLAFESALNPRSFWARQHDRNDISYFDLMPLNEFSGWNSQQLRLLGKQFGPVQGNRKIENNKAVFGMHPEFEDLRGRWPAMSRWLKLLKFWLWDQLKIFTHLHKLPWSQN